MAKGKSGKSDAPDSYQAKKAMQKFRKKGQNGARCIMHRIGGNEMIRRFITMEGVLASGDRQLEATLYIKGEGPKGAFSTNDAKEEIRLFNKFLAAAGDEGPFKIAVSEAINGSRKKEYRKPKYSILPRDIEIQRVVRAPKPLPIKCKGNVTKAVIRQRALNEQVKAHFMVDVTFNAQKGGCTDGVIKHLIATLMSTIANGSRTMGERVRKLGVDHLLSCGAPTAFAPLISLFGKLRVNPPRLALRLLKKLDGVGLGQLSCTSKVWNYHIGWSHDNLWRSRVVETLLSATGNQLKTADNTMVLDPIVEGWLREQNFPWRAAYSSLYLYSEMCASRGPNQLEWTVDRNGDIKPQWTEHKWEIMQNAIKINQLLCPAFSPLVDFDAIALGLSQRFDVPTFKPIGEGDCSSDEEGTCAEEEEEIVESESSDDDYPLLNPASMYSIEATHQYLQDCLSASSSPKARTTLPRLPHSPQSPLKSPHRGVVESDNSTAIPMYPNHIPRCSTPMGFGSSADSRPSTKQMSRPGTKHMSRPTTMQQRRGVDSRASTPASFTLGTRGNTPAANLASLANRRGSMTLSRLGTPLSSLNER